MKKLFTSLWAFFALIALPMFAFAQAAAPNKGMAVTGYTDAQGKVLPGGDTRMSVTSDGKRTTMKLSNLYAYGEATLDANGNGKRQAWYGSNPEYFKGGTVYAMKLGNDWRGGRTAASVDLKADNGLAILAASKVGNDEVVLNFDSRHAGANVQYDCQPLNYLLVKADGKRAWLGHPGWAQTNTSASIGDHMVLAQNDKRFPATAVCYDKNGQIVKLTPAMRAELAKVIQPPAGAEEATAKAKDD